MEGSVFKSFENPEEDSGQEGLSKKESDIFKEGDAFINEEKIKLLEKQIDLAILKIRELDPQKVNPDWLIRNCNDVYKTIKKEFRTLEGKINWQLFADFLPPDIKSKWSYAPQRDWSGEKPKKAILKLLIAHNPKTFNPNWIKTKDYGLYKHLRRKFKNKETGKIRWEDFIDQLPIEWQERWIKGLSDEKKQEIAQQKTKFTFESAINTLNKLLREHDPNHFTSKYIERLDKDLHSYFKRRITREKGGIDWEKIISKVDEKYQARFRPPKRFEDEYPEKRYENEDEVEELLNVNREALFTFFSATNAEDRQKRNDLCLELINLAKKGNLLAEDRLIQYFEILVSNWIERDRSLKVFSMDTEGLRERIRRCIYLYRNDRATSFAGYLYINLREEAKGKGYKEIELDSHHEGNDGRGRSRHETVDLDFLNQDTELFN